MKKISAVDLRNNLAAIIKCLKRGEHLELTYRGKSIAEMIPLKSPPKMTPLEALRRAQAIAAQDPDYAKKTEAYLAELREDQKAWGERSP